MTAYVRDAWVRKCIRLGVVLRQLRKSSDQSLRDIEHLTGISNPMLSQIEQGKRLPGMVTMLKLAGVYRVSIDWILLRAGFYDDSPNP